MVRVKRCCSITTTAVLLILLPASVDGQFNSECFQFIGGPFVDADTISYELTTIKTKINDSALWSSMLNASWAKPSDEYVGSYVVFLEVIPTKIRKLPNCIIQQSDVVVNESMYIRDDLPFGFHFRLTVQTTNERSTIRNILSNSAQFFNTNDCYLETLDAVFCSSRPTETQFVGSPYNLRIDSVYPNITNPNTVLANISWLAPLQLNPKYVLNGYRVTYMDKSRSIDIGSIPHDDRETDFRYSALLTELQVNESYTVKVVAFVSKDSSTELGKYAELTFQTPTTFEISTTTMPRDANEITTRVMHHGNEITLTRVYTETSKPEDLPETAPDEGRWMDENRTVVILVSVCASLLVVGSLAFACYIAQVKEEKFEQQVEMVGKFGNEYL